MLSSVPIWTATRNVMLSPSRLPGVDDVARPAARCKEQHVDADRVARAGVAMRDRLDRGGDAAQAVFVDRGVEAGAGGPPLDLDEGDSAPPAGDEVDLAARRLHPPSNDPPALQPQPQRRPALAAAAMLRGNLALHSVRCSSARA